MATVLEVQHLIKDYPGIRAVDGISFAIEGGTCFGLLGPNGAGKTTTIEIAEGIVSPTAGHVLYKGEPRDGSFQEEIGIQFQSTALLAMLTVRESVETFRRLYQHPRPMKDLVDFCHLEDILDRRNDKISGGQRQRLLLAMALVNDPALIFLDEPTTGLDPQARRYLWDIVNTVKAEGKTIVLTTHYMEEAEILCDDIAIVDQGKIIACGTPAQLLNEDNADATISLPEHSLPENPDALFTALKQTAAVTDIQSNTGGVVLLTGQVNACFQLLIEHGVDLSAIRVRSKNLEDLFIQLTGRRLRE